MLLNKTSCVDSLPPVIGNYAESKGLLLFTVYGNYCLGTFRKNVYNIPFFYPASESRPYSVREVIWWAELPEDGEVGSEIDIPLSIK